MIFAASFPSQSIHHHVYIKSSFTIKIREISIISKNKSRSKNHGLFVKIKKAGENVRSKERLVKIARISEEKATCLIVLRSATQWSSGGDWPARALEINECDGAAAAIGSGVDFRIRGRARASLPPFARHCEKISLRARSLFRPTPLPFHASSKIIINIKNYFKFIKSRNSDNQSKPNFYQPAKNRLLANYREKSSKINYCENKRKCAAQGNPAYREANLEVNPLKNLRNPCALKIM